MLRLLIASIAVLLYSGCESEPLAELDRKQQAWESGGPERYTLSYVREGAWTDGDRFEVTVSAGEVDSVAFDVSSSPPPSYEAARSSALTAERLFNLARRALSESEEARIEYDDQFHFPASVYSPGPPGSFDAQYLYTVVQFTPTQ